MTNQATLQLRMKSNWESEIKSVGWQSMLEDRLVFHGGLLHLNHICECTHRCITTVRNHCEKLVKSGIATWSEDRMKILLVE
jgi:hypothetical protein